MLHENGLGVKDGAIRGVVLHVGVGTGQALD